MPALRWIVWALARLVIGARYRLSVRGREQLQALKGPVLILPNHPGYIDPFLLFSVLWPVLQMRPLVYRGTFQGLTGRFLVWLVNALEVPDLDVASVRARAEAEQAIATIAAGLARAGTVHPLARRPRLAAGRCRADRSRPCHGGYPPFGS
jgi:1-acyl-sn-glycerol-3-phosphate acyltransferase